MGPTRVIMAEMGFNIGNPGQWRLKKAMAGGGSMMDIGIYGLNAARYLTGEEPTEVYAMISTTPNDVRFAEVEENITFQLRFPSGILANCVSSYGTSFNKFRVNKKRGAFELDPATPYTGLRMRVFRGGTIEDRSLPQRDHFQLEMDHFSECIQTNKEPLTPGEEGLKDMQIIEAIYESARDRQADQAGLIEGSPRPRGRLRRSGPVRRARPRRPGRQQQRILPTSAAPRLIAGADRAAPPGRQRQHHRQRQHEAGGVERVGDPRGRRRPFRGHAGADGGANPADGMALRKRAASAASSAVSCSSSSAHDGHVGDVRVQGGVILRRRLAVQPPFDEDRGAVAADHRTAPAAGAIRPARRLRARCRWLRTVLIGMSSIAATCS